MSSTLLFAVAQTFHLLTLCSWQSAFDTAKTPLYKQSVAVSNSSAEKKKRDKKEKFVFFGQKAKLVCS